MLILIYKKSFNKFINFIIEYFIKLNKIINKYLLKFKL